MNHRERDAAVERWLREARETMTADVRVESPHCLDAETLAAWSEGQLRADERSRAEAHAARCARCQAMLAAMARTAVVSGSASTAPAWSMRKWMMMLTPAVAGVAALVIWVAVNRSDIQQPLLRNPAASTELAKSTRPPAAARPSEAPASRDNAKDQERSQVDNKRLDQPRREAEGRLADGRTYNEKLRVTVPNSNVAPVERPSASAAKPDADERDRVAPKEMARARSSVEELQGRQAQGQQGGVPSAAPQAAPPPPPAQQQAQQQPSPQQQQQQPPQQTADQFRTAPADKVEQFGARTAAGRGGAGAAAAPAAAAETASASARRGVLGFTASPNSPIRWRANDGGRVIERSTDSGATWVRQYEGDAATMLLAASSPSETVCWMVGRAGLVMRSIDGLTWQRVRFPETVDLGAVTALDAKAVKVTTADGRTFTTTDGGATWQRQN